MTTETAYDRFRVKRSEIYCQIQTLRDLMDAETDLGPRGIHWGHVGDLGHVEEILQQAINFLLNQDDPA